MGSMLKKLWKDPDYFRKMMVAFIATAAMIVPTLPLGELGVVGYWLSKFAIPISIALGASVRGSGLNAEEAAKLRALIPAKEVLDKKAPKI